MKSVRQHFSDFGSGTLEFSEKQGAELTFERDRNGDLAVRADVITDANTFFLSPEQAVALRDFLNERFS